MALLSQVRCPDRPSAWAVILRCRAGKQNLAGCFLGSKDGSLVQRELSANAD